MIFDAHIRYVRNKGCTVRINPDHLFLSKQWRSKDIGIYWMIAQHDLKALPFEAFCQRANHLMFSIMQAIRAKEQVTDHG